MGEWSYKIRICRHIMSVALKRPQTIVKSEKHKYLGRDVFRILFEGGLLNIWRETAFLHSRSSET